MTSHILARPIADLSLDELMDACRQAHERGQDAFDSIGDGQEMGAHTPVEAEILVTLGYQGVVIDGLGQDGECSDEDYERFDDLAAGDDPRIACFVEGWRYAVRQHARQAAANAAVWQQAQ